MGLFRRVGDILSANLNDMVDTFENPERMLRQAIREMDSAIAAALDGAAKVIATEKLLAQQVADHVRQADACQRRAVQALTAADDARARQALHRKQEHQALVAALQDQLTAAQKDSAILRRQIDAMHVKLAEAKRKLTSLTARRNAAMARRSLFYAADATSASGRAFSRFERMREKIEQTEAEVAALSELTRGPLDETTADETGNDLGVEAELAALKRSAHTNPPVSRS